MVFRSNKSIREILQKPPLKWIAVAGGALLWVYWPILADFVLFDHRFFAALRSPHIWLLSVGSAAIVLALVLRGRPLALLIACLGLLGLGADLYQEFIATVLGPLSELSPAARHVRITARLHELSYGLLMLLAIATRVQYRVKKSWLVRLSVLLLSIALVTLVCVAMRRVGYALVVRYLREDLITLLFIGTKALMIGVPLFAAGVAVFAPRSTGNLLVAGVLLYAVLVLHTLMNWWFLMGLYTWLYLGSPVISVGTVVLLCGGGVEAVAGTIEKRGACGGWRAGTEPPTTAG